ncbi:MAG: MarR family transcriptional regulator [Candidatus Micrarchaeota archaeon]|nr:MarR family transcriptional regulator [Candidatus Micrarchaeota archaeon]
MQQSCLKLTRSEQHFLTCLAEGSDKNDSKIAKEMGLNRSSISRIRKKLLEEGVLTGRYPPLDLEKMGVCFYHVIVFQWNAYADKKLTQKMEKDFTSTPHTIYFAEGSNPGSKYIANMAFLTFEEYNDFLAEFKEKYGKYISGLESFFIQPKRILKEGYGDLAKLLIGGV